MAIQDRRGPYSEFDPNKMLSAEWATVTSGDPNAKDGRSVYKCFVPGDVKRMATYEDMEENIDNATQNVQEAFTAQLTQKISQANTAISNAEAATSAANTAAQGANTAKQEALDAAGEAREYVLGDISQKTVTFEQASDRENINSGESQATLFGKIKKWFSDLGAAAFQAVANNLTTTVEGSVLDARQGKVLKDAVDQLNTNRYNAPMTLTGQWTIGFNVRGWGIVIPIFTNRGITIDHAEVYDNTSNWVDLTYQSQNTFTGVILTQFTFSAGASLSTGNAYLTRITGTIV